ncbi:hypothetical protein HK103_004527 [Boothiomyces macroporosus]|uniref:Uncharacterized protein n=1 Tax=Boothiomyces macroporosus TaxID=261099 RepID=A0AAD5UK47_9FUNG|nr:hypothetical protein HK103_004527 [Boothiomyces macroporosus]
MLGYGFLIVLYDNIQSVYITTLIYMASKNKTEKLAISFKESLSLNCFILFMDLLGCAAIVGTLFTTGTVNDIFSCIFDATIGNHVSLLIQMFKKIVKLKFADTITSSVRSSQIKSANSIQSPTASQTGFPNPAVMKSSENVKEVVPSSSVSNEKVALSNQVNDENSDKFTSNLKQFYKKEIVQRNGSKIERRPSAQK